MSRIALQVPQFGNSKCDPRDDPDQAPFQREAIKILEQYLQPDGQLMLRDATKQLLTLLTHPDRQIMRERVNGLTDQSRWATTYDLDHPLHAEQPLVQRLIEANLNHDAFSNLVVEAARRIPFDHPAQVKLVRLLSLMTPRADSAGCLFPMKRSEQPYWQTDHIMERAEDDRIFSLPSFPTYKPSNIDLEAHFSYYVNYHAFLAYLNQFKIIEELELPLNHLRTCFEEGWCHVDEEFADHQSQQVEQIEDRLSIGHDEARVKIRSTMLSAGAMWILNNGSSLFIEMVQCPRDIDAKRHEDKIFRTGPLFDGPIFGIKRWTFWREGFQAAARGNDVDEKCAALAAKAANIMWALEGGMWY